jgi:phosphoribosylanthranilate isomerase
MAEVKICGLSTAETMQAALDMGADFVGLNFFPGSPRYVSIAQATKLSDQARGRTKIVALVVDADDGLLREIVSNVKPDLIQAHGRETPERIAEIKTLTGIEVYKVLLVSNADHASKAKSYAASPFVLFDAKPPEGAMLPGGNGITFDWTILREAEHPFMLAGGLNPQNVAEAIKVTGADMVDVSSGVESAPGIKDINLIRKFIEAAKASG